MGYNLEVCIDQCRGQKLVLVKFILETSYLSSVGLKLKDNVLKFGRFEVCPVTDWNYYLAVRAARSEDHGFANVPTLNIYLCPDADNNHSDKLLPFPKSVIWEFYNSFIYDLSLTTQNWKVFVSQRFVAVASYFLAIFSFKLGSAFVFLLLFIPWTYDYTWPSQVEQKQHGHCRTNHPFHEATHNI